MNFEANELLDHVDQWKRKLSEKLDAMSPQQRAAFWKQIRKKAKLLGRKQRPAGAAGK